MSNKGLIRFLAIVLALACLFHLSFTVVTQVAKHKADKFAAGDPDKEAKFYDSIGKESNYYLGYSYKQCLENELNFGLDLKGGMNVILEVSVADVIDALSNHCKDPNYQKAMKLAKNNQKNSQDDFLTLFGKACEEVAPNSQLATYFSTVTLQKRVTLTSTNAEVIKVLREECDAAIANSFNVLRTRIDRFGVTQPNIQPLTGQTGRILVELPGVKDPERVKSLLKGTANLEFWTTYNFNEIYGSILNAEARIKQLIDAKYDFDNNSESLVADNSDTTLSLLPASDTASISLIDNVADTVKNSQSINAVSQYPLQSILKLSFDEMKQPIPSARVGVANVQDTLLIGKYLRCPKVREVLPANVRFFWGVKGIEDRNGKETTTFELVAIKTDARGNAALNGDVVTNAREEFDQKGGAYASVSMTMNAEGARKWARITRDNKGRQVAIVLDNLVYSYPNVNQEITGGNSQITGKFSITEAKDLANILKSGKLPAPAKVIEESIVGPSLGQSTINQGLISFAVAFLLVILYMILWYRMAGVASAIALICNVFFLIGIIASFGAVLTLPGIAGIVLTMGMAVDANVIIYERIREELHNNKGLKLAIQEGYRNSYSAILDGNCTTLITGIVLYIFGHGPIQGFATTLVFGIITTLVTGIFITRLFFEALLNKNKDITFWNKSNEFAFKNTSFNFIDKKKTFYIVSAILVVVSIASMATKGFDQGVDFLGGRTFVVKFDNQVSTVDVASKLEKALESTPQVKSFGTSGDQVKIVTKYRIDDEGDNVDSEIQTILYDNLISLYKTQNISRDMFLQGFVLDANGAPKLNNNSDIEEYGFQSSSKVGPTIADDIKQSASISIFLSIVFMFLYILIRFKNWQFGAGATVALIHDSIIVLGIFSLFSSIMPFSMEIDQSFIAAILTIVGYSINDTVVVFDRVREFLGLHKHTPLKQNMNDAINSTLSRTINTSLTTLVVLLIIFIFGGTVIRGFVFALLLGIIVGTYSSVFIASPIAYDLLKRKKIEENAENAETAEVAKN